MGRPRKEDRPEAIDGVILKAAESAFGADGYRDTRLGDIAESVGIRRSSLLYHFKSKDNLYASVVDRAFAELRVVVAGSIGQGDTAEAQLDSILDGLLRFADERPGLVCVILRELVDPRGGHREQVADAFGTLIDNLEMAFVGLAGDKLVPGFPVRSAILQIVCGYLVRAASGTLGDKLWQGRDETREIASALLLTAGTGRRVRSTESMAPIAPAPEDA